ncbi:hypothetical protein AN476_20765 [Phaeobacter sp. 11ANDIMAR09]|nr:hypothetical protein AN476_20765 [Phaeobacter sp. 11ANDIMAR09]
MIQYEFDLTTAPEVRRRLVAICPDTAVGQYCLLAVATISPFTKSGWTQAWSRLRKMAKVPKDL